MVQREFSQIGTQFTDARLDIRDYAVLQLCYFCCETRKKWSGSSEINSSATSTERMHFWWKSSEITVNNGRWVDVKLILPLLCDFINTTACSRLVIGSQRKNVFQHWKCKWQNKNLQVINLILKIRSYLTRCWFA